MRVFLASLALLAAAFAASAAESAKRPNFIVVMADDCSAKEYSLYGNTEIRTPRLDSMGAEGVWFRTCWSAPICSPSRAMIMTGRYAYRTKWYHNDMKPAAPEPGYDISKENIIFAQALKDAGYATGVCGKWQLSGVESAYGFDEAYMHQATKDFTGPIEPLEGSLPGRPARYWHPAITYQGKQIPTGPDDYAEDMYVEFILDFAKRHRSQPFLVYYPMSLPHITWDFDLNRMGYVAPPELDANGRKTGRKGEPTLKASVEYIDHLMGRIMDGLAELGLRDDTILFFTCDNGTAGYGKGQPVEERGSRVPMVVYGPNWVKPRGASDALVDFSDMLPTLVEMGGAKLPEGYEIDGKSFAPVLRGETDRVRDWIFSNLADMRFLRDERWLLDGAGKFYDTQGRRDETGYIDVTGSKDPEVLAARARFDEILKAMPEPDPSIPFVQNYVKKRAMAMERRAQSQAAWEAKYGSGELQPKGKKKAAQAKAAKAAAEE